MNGCEYFQELISRMLDEDISREERAELAKHLENCPECSMMYRAFSTLSDAISCDLEEPPEDLADNIMADIRRSEIIRKNSKKRMPRRIKSYIAAAACVAVMIAAVGGTAIVRSSRRDAATFESSARHISSGTISDERTAKDSVEVPAAASAAPNTDTGVSAQAANVPDDSNNFGYVPENNTPNYPTAPVSAPPVDLSQYPVNTPPVSTAAPYTAPTPTPTPVVTPTPTPVPTAEPTPEPTPEATPAPTPEQPEQPDNSESASGEAVNGAQDENLGENFAELPNDELQAPAGSTPAESTAPDAPSTPAERRIDLRAVDVSELLPKLFATEDEEKADSAEDNQTAAEGETGAEPSAEVNYAPELTPPEIPDAAATPAAGADNNEEAPVVSTPSPLSEQLKKLLPPELMPDNVDIISYCDAGTPENMEKELLACICSDQLVVLELDDNNQPLVYMPKLTGEEYAVLIEQYIKLAEQPTCA